MVYGGHGSKNTDVWQMKIHKTHNQSAGSMQSSTTKNRCWHYNIIQLWIIQYNSMLLLHGNPFLAWLGWQRYGNCQYCNISYHHEKEYSHHILYPSNYYPYIIIIRRSKFEFNMNERSKKENGALSKKNWFSVLSTDSSKGAAGLAEKWSFILSQVETLSKLQHTKTQVNNSKDGTLYLFKTKTAKSTTPKGNKRKILDTEPATSFLSSQIAPQKLTKP